MWKVGELAKQAGVTVRTLHHYHEIGLLIPSGSTGSGHRLYADRDVARLLQIVLLRQLGFSLEQILECLTGEDPSPQTIVELRLKQLDEQIVALTGLRQKLAGLKRLLQQAECVTAELFLQTLKGIHMIEKYYTPEQLAELRDRAAADPQRVQEVEAEWPRLMASVQAEMDRGTPPTDPTVRALAERWQHLVDEFTGGNPTIQQSLNSLYQNESTISGMDLTKMRPMMDYIRQSLGHS